MLLRQVENFFPNLDRILPEIKKVQMYNQEAHQAKFKIRATWPGYRSAHLSHENIFLYEFVNNLLYQHKLLEPGTWEIHSFVHLRLDVDKDKDWIHKDMQDDLAALIYLSETNFDSGTYLFDENEKLINNIVAVKNRAVIYSAKYNHMGYGHFGTNINDGRLTINCFIKNHGYKKG